MEVYQDWPREWYGSIGNWQRQAPDNRSILEKAKARRAEIAAELARVESLRIELETLDRMITAADASR